MNDFELTVPDLYYFPSILSFDIEFISIKLSEGWSLGTAILGEVHTRDSAQNMFQIIKNLIGLLV